MLILPCHLCDFLPDSSCERSGLPRAQGWVGDSAASDLCICSPGFSSVQELLSRATSWFRNFVDLLAKGSSALSGTFELVDVQARAASDRLALE